MRGKTLAIILTLITTSLFSEVLVLDKFKGIITDDNPLWINKSNTPDSENVVTDEGFGLKPRKGFISFASDGSNNLWVFPHSDGTRYFITQTSVTLKADTGSGTFTITIGTVDINVNTVATSLGDRWYFANTTDGLYSWDGTDLVAASTTLRVDQLVAHKGRLWASGLESDPRTLYGSEFLDGTSWTLQVDPTAGDPTQIQLSGRLDESLIGLYSSFRDVLIWFKPNSFGAIYGSNRSNFLSRILSDEVGTSFPRSIHDADGELRWLGPRRTFWGFDGVNISKISESIDDLVGTILQGDRNSRTWTQSTQTNFESGTLSDTLDSATLPGFITIDAESVIDDFTDGDFTASPVWSPYVVSSSTWSVASQQLKNEHLGGTPTAGLYTSNTISTGSWSFTHQKSGATTTSNFSVRLCTTTPVGFGQFEDVIICYRYTISGQSGGIAQLHKQFSGTGLLGTITLPNSPMDGSVHSYKITRSSSSEITIYQDDIPLGTVTDTTYNNFTFIAITVGAHGSPGESHIFDDFKVAPFLGDFQSVSFNIGDSISSWDTFTNTESLNGGVISYALYTDTDTAITITDSSSFTSSQTITNGSIPTVSTASFVVVTSAFSRTFSTHTPTLDNFSLSWNEGSLVPVPSAFFNKRSWWSVGISSTGNNTILLYDREREWQKYTGIEADSMSRYNSRLYFGNESNIFQAEIGANDNGVDITSFWQSKTFAPSGPNNRSFFSDVYITSENSDATLQADYFIDGINTAFGLADVVMNLDTGIQDFQLPFPMTEIQQGKTISIKFTVTGSDTWRLLHSSLYFDPEKVPIDN